jgi:NHL repeat
MGSTGSGSGQLSEPRGIAVGPENSILVADSANRRVAKWAHADLDPQSGIAVAEIRVDGTQVQSWSPGCATRDCTMAHEWTLNADSFSAGAHTLRVITTDGVGLSTESAPLSFESHPDKAAPSVSLSGTMTEQGTLGSTRPNYTLLATETDPAGSGERSSGVASSTVKLDGATIKSTSPGCPSGGCGLNQEWTLATSGVAAGSHTVEVISTDADGHVTTKTLTISVQRDTTAPELTANSKFFTAAGGWLTQKNYIWTASATDAGGFGVTSMELKIDGKVVAESHETCSAGACGLSLGAITSMAEYQGVPTRPN